MQFVPWRYLADWKCTMCGECCRYYSVVLNFPEWLGIVKNYGVEQTASSLNKLFIKRRGDGSCAFLSGLANTSRCGLQHAKPRACKLWPFKVLDTPRFGFGEEAAYSLGSDKFFIYVDPMCNGIRYGTPNWSFASQTLREFVEVAVGARDIQMKSTGTISFPNLRPSLRDLSFRRLF